MAVKWSNPQTKWQVGTKRERICLTFLSSNRKWSVCIHSPPPPPPPGEKKNQNQQKMNCLYSPPPLPPEVKRKIKTENELSAFTPPVKRKIKSNRKWIVCIHTPPPPWKGKLKQKMNCLHSLPQWKGKSKATENELSAFTPSPPPPPVKKEEKKKKLYLLTCNKLVEGAKDKAQEDFHLCRCAPRQESEHNRPPYIRTPSASCLVSSFAQHFSVQDPVQSIADETTWVIIQNSLLPA